MDTSKALGGRSRRRRARRTAAEVAALLGEFHQGGLSQRAFAISRRIPLSTFSYWLRREGEAATAPARVERRLVPVTLTGPGPWETPSGESIEVVLRTGDILRLPCRFDDSALRRLLGILEERC